MFGELTENLQNVFNGFQTKKTLTEDNIESAVREVKRALINADVSLKAVKTFSNKVKEKAVGIKVLKGISPREQFIKIVNDELVLLLGSEKKDLNLFSAPSVILVLGLQGSGKTITSAKLANLLRKAGKNPLLVPLDLKRPAAVEQLKILGETIGIDVFPPGAFHEMPLLAKNAIKYAKENNYNVVILDSAGRLQIDTEMMAELLLIDRTVQPDEKLLVIDSMIGQEACNIAGAFNIQIGITGIILTKLDGDSRGGAALSVAEETGKPVKFIGTGEKIEDLQEFYPERIASRILGMGDILTLVEKTEEKIKEEEAKELEEKLLSDFNFDTFLQVQEMFSRMGNLSSVFSMLGLGGMLSQFGINLNKEAQEKLLKEGEEKLKNYKPLIQSMTKEERKNPDVLNLSRKTRLARGSGLKMKDADLLISEFRKTKQMMTTIKPFLGMFQAQSAPCLPNPKQNTRGNILKGFKTKKKN